MGGQAAGQLVAIELDLDEVLGQRKLLLIQHAVTVTVGQLPDLAQDAVGQLGRHHLLLGVDTGYLAVDGRQGVEELIVDGLVFGHDPLLLIGTLLGALPVALVEGALGGAVEGAALHELRGHAYLLLADEVHQGRDLVAQHVVHRLDQLGLQRVEFGEVIVLQLLLQEEKPQTRSHALTSEADGERESWRQNCPFSTHLTPGLLRSSLFGGVPTPKFPRSRSSLWGKKQDAWKTTFFFFNSS